MCYKYFTDQPQQQRPGEPSLLELDKGFLQRGGYPPSGYSPYTQQPDDFLVNDPDYTLAQPIDYYESQREHYMLPTATTDHHSQSQQSMFSPQFLPNFSEAILRLASGGPRSGYDGPASLHQGFYAGGTESDEYQEIVGAVEPQHQQPHRRGVSNRSNLELNRLEQQVVRGEPPPAYHTTGRSRAHHQNRHAYATQQRNFLS
ncbi:hypothetical protein QAD02_018972 [Eretmocerus hayati]|uniref:Uncharacterized protein n=1 Tax=Eretmocerus hayati TaxID=131215 RepID=A0ACC2PIC8_9HYME|nr:hypothetical protein QAD02_018972 [Eretmocerus hayati]